MVLDEIKCKLLPYQIEHVEKIIQILDKRNRCLDMSDTGTGKTYAAAAVLKHYGSVPFIVAPKSVLKSWRECFKIFGITNYYLVNYEMLQNCYCYKGPLQIKMRCKFIQLVERIPRDKETEQIYLDEIKIDKKNDGIKKTKKIKTRQVYKWTIDQNVDSNIFIIFDEVHKCKNILTNNASILKGVATLPNKVMLLSATVAENTKKFVTCGYVLGLYGSIALGKEWINNCQNIYGTDNPITGLHQHIMNEYAIRMRIKDTGNMFQKNMCIAALYEMENAVEIEQMYKLIEDSVNSLKKKEDAAQALAALTYARMRIEMLKVPKAVTLAKEYIAAGKSVCLFVNYTDTINLLSKELDTTCIIYGDQNIDTRNNNIDDFNNDKQRIILCNIKSGGVGISLHDTKGIYPRVAIIFPQYSAQDMLQTLGRIHRANGKTECYQYILFCKGTIEEDICELVKEKIKNISIINDGNEYSYCIQNMIEEGANSVADETDFCTDFEKVYKKIDYLNERKKRLTLELKQTEDELKGLELELENTIYYN